MTTETHYELRVYSDAERYYVRRKGAVLGELIEFAHSQKSEEAVEYKIYRVETITTCLEIFEVPAHVKSVEEVIDDIIGYSDGSNRYYEPDELKNFDEATREKIWEAVHSEMDSCDCCGVICTIQDLSGTDEGELCWRCENDMIERQEEEEENSDED
jgi:hypothetical protein